MIFYRRGARNTEGFSEGQFGLCASCLLIILFLLAGCAAELPAAALPVPLPTAVLPTAVPLPTLISSPTASAPLLTAPSPTKPPPSRLPPSPTHAPTPTFAAYGIQQSIGLSLDGRSLDSYAFGYGARKIVLVGGMHGGYEWNTILLAYQLVDYFTEHPEEIPAAVTLFIIPVVNVDGQVLITGQDGRFTPEDVALITVPGRFNARGVDLNRNWDCEWQAEAKWNGRAVSAGSEPFSEPETQVLRRFLLRQRPELVVFWHSKANGIFAGGCGAVDEASLAWGEVYGRAAGYPVYEKFTAYPITGDASDWLARQGVPSFTVELETPNQTEWQKNLAGVQALLKELSRTE